MMMKISISILLKIVRLNPLIFVMFFNASFKSDAGIIENQN